LTDSFEVITGAIASYVASSLTPREVNSSDNAAFSLQLLNSGQANAFLQASGTFLTFGSDTYYLLGNQTLTGNNAISTLTFTPGVVQTVAAVSPYTATLYLAGQENGAAYNDTITISDQISVFNIPVVQIQLFTITSPVASQGEGGIQLSYLINNTGALSDDIRIQVPSDLILHNKSGGTFLPTLTNPLLAQFPVTIPASTARSIQYTG
jgi:hypothetical protein